MHNFKKLKVWTKAREIVKEIYLLSKKFPIEEKFGLISQIQRASVSIPSNIAEGSGRSSEKDFLKFLNLAISSEYELETHILLAFDLEYIKKYEFDEIISLGNKMGFAKRDIENNPELLLHFFYSWLDITK